MGLGAVQAGQFFSLFYNKELLNYEAFEHWDLAGYYLSLPNIIILILFLGINPLVYFSIRKKISRVGNKISLRKSITFFFIIGLYAVLNNNLDYLKKIRFEFAANRKAYIAEFLNVVVNYRHHKNKKHLDEINILYSEYDIKELKRNRKKFYQGKADFRKESVYSQQLFVNEEGKQFNLIVIFAESLTADMLGVYGAKAQAISPNIDLYAKKSLVFEEYYNHAFPTIIGLKGQLCSIFPRYTNSQWQETQFEKPKDPIHCLPEYLSNVGYETTYFGYSHPGETFFEAQMRNFGFTNTLFYKEFLARYVGKDEAPERSHKGNSDRQMFAGLLNFLKEKEKEKNTYGRFFVAMSTIETHGGLDVLDSQASYGEGDNKILNRFHNFDAQFGVFWSEFSKLPLSKDTILVLTADHAHGPSVDFEKVVGRKAFHLDIIPLVVWHPMLSPSSKKFFQPRLTLRQQWCTLCRLRINQIVF